MSLGGPRLDRPSAIGDEGRPRAASLVIATLTVVALGVAAGLAIGEPSLVTTLATVVGLTVAGIALLDRTGFLPQAVGYTVVVTAGSLFSVLVVVAPFVGRIGLVVAGFAFALFGLGMAWADVDSDGLTRATVGCLLTYGSVLVSLLLVGMAAGFAVLGWGILGVITSASTPTASLAGLLVVLASAATLWLVALWLLPIRQLRPRTRRDLVERRLETATRSLAITIVGSFGSVLVVAALWATGLFAQLLAAVPALESALVWLSSPVIVWPLVGVSLLALGAGVAAVTIRQLTRQLGGEGTPWSIAILVGAGLVGAGTLVMLVLLVGAALGASGPGLLVGLGPLALFVLLLFGPIVFLLVFGSLLAGIAMGLLPGRAAGPAIAAFGLVLAAIGLSTTHPVFVFVCLAGALVVWDVSTFGLGITAELGHIPESRRLELFHGVLSIGLGIGAVVLAIGLEVVRTGLFGGVGGSAGLFAIGIGVLVVLVPLQG